MTAKEAHALVSQVYPQAFEDTSEGGRIIRGGPINRKPIGNGATSAQAWKNAAERLAPAAPATMEEQ